MGITRLSARAATTAATVVLVLALGTQGAVAVPPPPPNPSDAELDSSRDTAGSRASRVGELTNEVARAEALLLDLQAQVALKLEEANKALVDLRTAEDEAARAKTDADAARAAATAAAEGVDDAREALDEFAAGSYKQGSTVGSLSAYLGATSPQDLLDRAQLLNVVGESQLDSLDDLERARTDKANKDSAARAALKVARDKADRARAAKSAADTATAAARQARQDQAARTGEIQARKDRAEQRLAAARARVGGLEDQRERYQDWLDAKQREDAANAAAATSSSTSSSSSSAPTPAPANGTVRAVINRALSQVGVPYAWGGGNAYGPTRGIRDGGVADSYGDYRKVGFDCSGLMIYAFAAAGFNLPHYSGYQYHAGPRHPLSQKRPGDMLFWATGGRIHHVALYIGNEQMVEAPYSGSHVRVTSVRYGGIVPQVTRLL
ncbi:NlpC/P60 family protein [Actinophytocola gossypii]|uniref:C40 family peptidase n=1 Tax=Actinophytocola gossypii TaxID=2812003 RepID=A0ABT2JGQ2_9PSEU|nr:NlpC/P60 family protein [Actinophytocola gossypii]MCT2587055.1 C40 family peptidase [Actinophytocola gossypii]